MPQPLSKVCSNATVSLHFVNSTNKPEIATLVAGIFARWAWIEHQLSLLLVYILGAQSKPALAMFSQLNTQRLQQQALNAAAREALPDDQFDVFVAVMSVIDCVQKDRHRLAHSVWGTCPELPDKLLLVDPDSLREREIKYEEAMSNRLSGLSLTPEILGGLFAFDPSRILVYSKPDLERSIRDLGEAAAMIVTFREYLNPHFPDDDSPEKFPPLTRAQAFHALMQLRQFREALDRAKASKNTPEASA